jgi:hypothetical protein
MDKPIKHTSGRKVRSDMKVSGIGVKRHMGKINERPRKLVRKDITKDEFLANLGKVCRPIGKESSESDLEKTET